MSCRMPAANKQLLHRFQAIEKFTNGHKRANYSGGQKYGNLQQGSGFWSIVRNQLTMAYQTIYQKTYCNSMLSICISLFSPSLGFFIKTQPQSKTPLLEGGQKYGNFSVASLRPNGKNPEKILRIAYGHLIRIQKELCLYLHLPPRYGPPDYGGKSGFL